MLHEARAPLVAFGNGYGDHLINLPALRALAWGYGGRMTLACHPQARHWFFSDLPLRRVVELPFDRQPAPDILRDAALPTWDALIWLNPWTAPWLESLIDAIGEQRSLGLFECFGQQVPRDYGKHSADLAFDLARSVFPQASFDDYSEPPVLPPEAVAWARAIRRTLPPDRRLLVVHADTEMKKRWPARCFRAVLDDFLGRRPDMMAVIIGKEDLGLEAGPHVARIVPAIGSALPHSMALVAEADLFLGVDSCFLHAADGFRVPAVGLFGPTDSREFGCRLGGAHRHVEGGGSMAGIEVQAVIDALEELESGPARRPPELLPPPATTCPQALEEMQRSHFYSRVENGRRLYWQVSRLWREAEALPVLDLAIEALDLDQTVWFEPGETPTVRKVTEHLRRVLATDPERPIILSASGELMDGWHRLARAIMEGHESIAGVRLPRYLSPDLVEELDAEEPGAAS